MAKRHQIWRPDTHPGLIVLQEVDTITGEVTARGVVENGEVRTENGEVDLNDREKQMFKNLTKKQCTKCKADAAEALALNQHKNAVVVPALLAALPDDEKQDIIDSEGNPTGDKTFKNPPVFRAVDGEIVANLSPLKSENRQKAQDALLANRRRR